MACGENEAQDGVAAKAKDDAGVTESGDPEEGEGGWASSALYLDRARRVDAFACGILRIFVAPEYRRRGVASRLVDAARSHVAHGVVFRADQVAFAQPTLDGRRLARSVSGETVLAY